MKIEYKDNCVIGVRARYRVQTGMGGQWWQIYYTDELTIEKDQYILKNAATPKGDLERYKLVIAPKGSTLIEEYEN